MSLKNGDDSVLSPRSTPQIHCDNCDVSNLEDCACHIVETDMAKLRVAGEEGCQLCELAFKCVAAREEYSETVSVQLMRLEDVVIPGDQTSPIRRVRVNPSFVPKSNHSHALGPRPRPAPIVFLSIYTRTYQAREHCRLSSKGTPVDVELESSPRKISGVAKSDQCFQLIDKWINKCVKEHLSCPSTTVSPLPTRVLDIGKSLDSKTVRLVEMVGQSGRYAALSHCWGGGYVPKTFQYISQLEEASVTSRMQGFPVSQLSNTFKDAVYIARRLGLQYLWIDSLCIFQDVENREDWERESSKMASVYENAFITIAATSASSGKAGCLGARPIATHRLEEFRSDSGNSIYVREKLQHEIFDWYRSLILDFSSAPLLHRAWCYQERLLSARVLHLTKCELVWECKTAVKCECGEADKDPQGKPHYSQFLSAGTHEDAKGKLERLAPLWRYLTCIYSGMGLTNPSDIFPALSGIASKFQCLELGRYIAGIWEHDLAEGLAWKTFGGKQKASRPDPVRCSYRAPSWSWASVMGPTNCAFYKKVSRKASPLRLLDVECAPKGVNALGEIHFGYIRVSAIVISAKLFTAGPFVKLVVRRARSKNWEFQFDFDVELAEYELESMHGQTVFLLQLFHADTQAEGLVLKREKSYVERGKTDGGTYERLGAFADAPIELFQGVEEVEIGLI